jgi:FlaA1/EpsC-like NDP-sugar epimerase
MSELKSTTPAESAINTTGLSGEVPLSRAQHHRGLWIRLLHAGLFTFSIAAAWGLAWALSAGASIPTRFPLLLATVVTAKAITFEFFRLHRASWRWFGLPDAAVITIANTSGSVLAALVLGPRVAALPVAALMLIEWLICQGLLLGSRMLYRVLREAKLGAASAPSGSKRVFIYGAGRRGVTLLRRIRANPRTPYDVVGFIDDDPAKRHLMMRMTPVFGNGGELPRLALLHQVREVLVAAGRLTGEERRRIRELAGFAGLPCRFSRRRGAARRKSRPLAHTSSRV